MLFRSARETQKTHGTHRRKERIQHVFEKLKDTSGLPEELPSNAELSNEREYLYWLQGGKAFGTWLLGVGEFYTELFARTEQTPEGREVGGGGDNQDFTNPGQHQHRHGIIYHRLVADGDELF